ncbi:putative cysteine proteinase inhibitor 7 [Coffea eugenioides]|uniref:Cysteine proteinase inhibitor 4 n=1 Tax=Coffea arabica TaxID=13443 RepID=A0A6P6XBA6_COFAR|nr:putative cysteine proteinase inhibitor 7 [Coffea arabica]XP_027168284.1 putative cysteine proteinase inhibitor 7 [Coffea eugenioides]
MTEVATNFQMADITANHQITEVANNYMKEFQSTEVDAILKQAGETKLIVPGGWTPVNPLDPHIQELGRFAVDEHNKTTKNKLVFVAVVAGLQKPLGFATLYWLLIAAKDSKGKLGLYKALVIEYLTGVKKLLYFGAVPFVIKNKD